MTRLTMVAAFAASALASLASLASTARAETQAEIAERLSEEGTQLLWAEKWAEATAKFRAASARVPEPKYYYKLCMSLMHEGAFGEALTACNHAKTNNPPAELTVKIDKLSGLIRDKAKEQGVSTEPVGGGGGPVENPGYDCSITPDDPRCGGPAPDVCRTNPQDPSCAAAPPPPQPRYQRGRPLDGVGVFGGTTPDNKYTWTLGVELFGGGGQVGRQDAFGSIAGGFRVKGDYLIDPASRIGTQIYLGLTHFGQGEMDAFDARTLDIVDFGVGLYKHFCLHSAARLCITPLAGVQLALMSPDGEDDGTGEQVFNYAAFGGRAELGLHYAFGTRFEHVLGIAAGANLYSKVLSGPSDDGFGDTAADVGLDKGGVAGYVGLGYTYRFRTPFGSAPFVTLE